MRGFALFWALALSAATLSWLDAALAHQVAVDDAQLALALLSQKRVVDRDVSHVLKTSIAQARGEDAQSLVADAARRLADAERFLESQYAMRGVDLDVFFGFWTEEEKGAWLDDLARRRVLFKCPRCLDVGVLHSVSSVLSVSNSSVVLSQDGLHRGSLPFLAFGRPVLGAVYRFGQVLGVTVV